MSVKKILILRPDNIGDVLLFTGALKHIKKLYLDAHITLAVQEHIINLVELCPYIDACVPVSHLTWLGKIDQAECTFKSLLKNSELRKAIRIINKFRNFINKPFDTIIYPVKSAQISHLEIIYCLSATETIGIIGCNLNEPKNGFPSILRPNNLFLKNLDISDADPWKHEFFITAQFLIFLGCNDVTIDGIKPQLWLADQDKNYLNKTQRNEYKIIGLFPGASSAAKLWPIVNYGKLANQLDGRFIYVIFGNSTDKDLANKISLSIKEYRSDVKIFNLTGQTTLRELAKNIMLCDLLIGMDTSGLHIAITAGIPTVGIVGGGHFGRFVPWGDPEKNIFLTNKMECFYCNWVCTYEKAECIKSVSPHEVASAVTKLLKY
jgi:ADP-heptose:LPS heptosyltransferase